MTFTRFIRPGHRRVSGSRLLFSLGCARSCAKLGTENSHHLLRTFACFLNPHQNANPQLPSDEHSNAIILNTRRSPPATRLRSHPPSPPLRPPGRVPNGDRRPGAVHRVHQQPRLRSFRGPPPQDHGHHTAHPSGRGGGGEWAPACMGGGQGGGQLSPPPRIYRPWRRWEGANRTRGGTVSSLGLNSQVPVAGGGPHKLRHSGNFSQ